VPEGEIALQQSELDVNQAPAATVPPANPEVNASPEPGDPALLERLKATQGTPENPKEPRTKNELDKEFERLYSETGKAYMAREYQKMQLDNLTNQFAAVCQEAEARGKLDRAKIEAAQAKRDRKAALRAGGKNGATIQTSTADGSGEETLSGGTETAGAADQSSPEGMGETKA